MGNTITPSLIPDALISIIVPVFNNENSIHRCLSALLGQSYKHIEIILVYLEGSDKTLQEIEAFNDRRVKIVHQERRTGPGGARNLGLDTVTGQLIGFCDADDWVEADFYEALYQALLSSNADIACAEMVTVSSNKEKFAPKIEWVSEDFESKLQFQQNGATFTKLFKAEIIQKHAIRFPEGRYWEDNPWLLEVLYYSNRMCFVTGTYYHYLPSAKSTGHSKRLENDVLPIARQMIGFVERHGLTNKERQQVEDFILRSFADGSVARRKNIYTEFKTLFKNHSAIKKLRQSYLRKNIIRFSLRKKYIVIFGHRFPQKG